MKRVLWLAVLCLGLWLVPAEAFAQAWSDCASGVPEDPLDFGQACYDFTDDTDSVVIRITNLSTFHFDPNTASAGADTGTVFLRRCLTTTASANTCPKVVVTEMTGADGATFIFDVPAGLYFVDVNTSAGGDAARARFVTTK